MRLGGSYFFTYNSGFHCAIICLSFMLIAVDFSRTQKGYSVHVFNLADNGILWYIACPFYEFYLR